MVGSWLEIGGAMACAVVVSACFSPTIPEGYACGAGGSCPPDQSCDVDGICRASSSGDDPDSGGAVDHDEDGDGVDDAQDNCPGLANPDQDDELDGGDGVGDACDPNPSEPGDSILYFASFAEPSAIDDWKSFSGQSSYVVVDDFLEQVDGDAGVTAFGIDSLPATVGTIEIRAQLITSVVPFESAFGAAAGLDQQGNAANGYACLRGAWSEIPLLNLVEVDRDTVAELESTPLDSPPPETLARHRFSVSPGGAGLVDLECEVVAPNAVRSLVAEGIGERNGRFGLVTVDASARFAYVLVYGR